MPAADQHSIDFIPRRGLRSAHAQTIAGWALPRRIALPPVNDRLFNVAPEAQILCRCHWQPDSEGRLTLIIVHGLEGSSESRYVIGTAHKAWLEGMNVVRMNMRNCGGTERLSRTLYHSGMSADLGAVAAALRDDRRVGSIALAGFSMGGNLVLKLAGEWASAPPAYVRAIAAVSPALDLGASADALHAVGNRLYEWNFLSGLKRRMRHKARLFPNIFGEVPLGGFASVRDFDDRVTARCCGFQSAEDYYERSSASRVIEHITLPTLVVYALDDPFIRVLPETREKLRANPNIRLIETTHGGHCGFLATPNGYDGRWAEQQIVSFVREFA
jgi:predicted alpha/beta-fold hydrolase